MRGLLLLIAIISVVVGSARAQLCTLYVDSASTNTSINCGQAMNGNNPCSNLHEAIKACGALGLVNMNFIFANGTYVIPNEKPLTIYNQTIIIGGSQQEGTQTIFQFENDDVGVVSIVEDQPLSGDTTSFSMSNVLVQGLGSYFIQSVTTVSSVMIQIQGCTFQGTNLATNQSVFSLSSSNTTQLTNLILTETNFIDFQYAGSNLAEGVLINAVNSLLTLQNSTLNNLSANASLIYGNNVRAMVSGNVFNNTVLFQIVYIVNSKVNINTNSFTNFNQSNPQNVNAVLFFSMESSCSIYRNNFTSISQSSIFAAVAEDMSQVSTTNQFALNNVTQASTGAVGCFFSANKGSNLYLSNNYFGQSSASFYFIESQGSDLSLSDNTFDHINGNIMVLFGDTSAVIVSNSFYSTGSVVVNCQDSTLSISSNLITPAYQANQGIVCDYCEINYQSCQGYLNPTTDPTKPPDHTKTAAIIICVLVAALIAACVAYYYYKKRHHHHHHHHHDHEYQPIHQ